MARTFLRQVFQIRNSGVYDDTVAAGSTLESAPTTLEDDLNGLRSQMKRAIWDDGAGNWYDDIPTINGKKRAIRDLNADLDDIEEKKFLFHAQGSVTLTDLTVGAGENWYVLNAAGSQTPTETAAVGAGTANGAVVAVLPGDVGSHSLVEVAGPNAISPKNLVLIRQADDPNQTIQSAGRDIYGLLQAESGTVDGDTFNDTTKQVQISFVIWNAEGNDLIACPVADIEGKAFNYSYMRRINLDAIPESAFISGIFTDMTASSDVTLDRAIDNQGSSPATQGTNIRVQIADTFSWDFEDSTGASDILSVKAASGADEVEFNVDVFDVNNAADADFLNGAIFDSGGTPIRVGSTTGYIDTASADLGIRAGGELYLDDSNQVGSTWAQTAGIKLSDSTAEWDNFETKFGEVSLLNAIYQAANVAGSNRGTKTTANVTADVAANADVGGVGGGTNLDAQLPDLSVGTFAQHDVFVNGNLMQPGANSGTDNDYYPGTSLANGQLKFEGDLKIGDKITVVVWT
jgi:hypothetical protein